MASRTTFPISFSPSIVNYRASAQVRAWKTYHESQESNNTNNAVDAEDESNGDFQRAAAAGEGASQSQQRRKKRERERGSPEVGRRVVRKLTQDDIRLTQTEARNPPGAFLISTPSYDDEAPQDRDWNPHGVKMVRVKQPFRPTNTLGQSTVQSAPKGNNFFAGRSNGQVLPTQVLKGGNVPKADDRFAIYQEGESGVKRQRLNTREDSQGRSSPVVDLTEPLDIFTGQAVPKRRAGSISTQPARVRRMTKVDNDPFSVNESARAAAFTVEGKQSQSSKRRRNNESRGGSQRSSVLGSAQSPPFEILDSSVEELGQNRHSPMVIVDSQESGHAVHVAPPLIDLERGYPQGNPKTSRGSQQDLKETNSMLAPKKPVRPTNKPPVPSRTASARAAAEDSHRVTQNLRTQFKRDSNKPKAKDRMREDSRNRLSSPDELDGGENHCWPHFASQGIGGNATHLCQTD